MRADTVTDADTLALMTPHLTAAFRAGEEKGYARGLADGQAPARTFAADSSDEPEAERVPLAFYDASGFTTDDAPRFADYFAADEQGRHRGDLHRFFGLNVRGFAEAAGCKRVTFADPSGRQRWGWAPRRDTFSDDAAAVFAEDFESFADRKDGDVWETNGRHYKREAGVTRRLRNPNAAERDAAKREKSEAYRKQSGGLSPKEVLQKQKADAEPKREEARAAWAAAVASPQSVGAQEAPKLAEHLHSLTRDEAREMARAALLKVGGLKADLIQRMLGKLGVPSEEQRRATLEQRIAEQGLVGDAAEAMRKAAGLGAKAEPEKESGKEAVGVTEKPMKQEIAPATEPAPTAAAHRTPEEIDAGIRAEIKRLVESGELPPSAGPNDLAERIGANLAGEYGAQAVADRLFGHIAEGSLGLMHRGAEMEKQARDEGADVNDPDWFIRSQKSDIANGWRDGDAFEFGGEQVTLSSDLTKRRKDGAAAGNVIGRDKDGSPVVIPLDQLPQYSKPAPAPQEPTRDPQATATVPAAAPASPGADAGGRGGAAGAGAGQGGAVTARPKTKAEREKLARGLKQQWNEIRNDLARAHGTREVNDLMTPEQKKLEGDILGHLGVIASGNEFDGPHDLGPVSDARYAGYHRALTAALDAYRASVPAAAAAAAQPAAPKSPKVPAKAPAVTALKRDPGADHKHLTALAAAAPDQDTRDALETAAFNTQPGKTAMTPEGRRHHTVERLAAVYRDATNAGKAGAAEHVAKVIQQFGGKLGDDAGKTVPLNASIHGEATGDSAPAGLFTGAPVRVVRPAVYGPDGRLAVKAHVEPT